MPLFSTDAAIAGVRTELVGKATAAQGALAETAVQPGDLAALAAAWTAIGSAEPISPDVGATWWEKNAAGVTLGQWEWTGSLWVSLSTRDAQAQNGNAFSTLNTGFGLHGSIYLRKFCLRANHTTPKDASNHYQIVAALIGRAGAETMSSATLTTTENLLAETALIVNPEAVLTHPIGFQSNRGHLRVFANTVGSPGNWQGQTAWSLTFSEVRQ